MARYAVIDLGTNTFHLLIAEEQADGTLVELCRERCYVKLAEDGIATISEAAFARGLGALHQYRNTIDKYEVKHIQAFGTAALRTASNGLAFTRTALAQTGINIRLIPGAEEARLIHKGVLQAVPLPKEKVLIMDIGGGSVEFIIADQGGVIWAKSFPIGVALLYNRFHKHDPIQAKDIEALEQYLETCLQTFLQVAQQHELPFLIGASGTFDVLENALVHEKSSPLHSKVEVTAFQAFYQSIIFSSLQERLALASIPASRADMIIVALVLVRFIVKQLQTQTIIVSAYAMKEGILREMMDA